MSVVCISQPRYLPSPAYLQRFHLCDYFVYLDTVQFTPRDWENRNRIKTPVGAQWLSVPVVREHRGQLIRDTRIDHSGNWARKHLESLRMNYSKAGFFDQVFPLLVNTLSRPWEYLYELNREIVQELLKLLGVSCQVVWASDLSACGKGSSLLLEITKELGGTRYLSGPLGRNYVVEEDFRAAGIDVAFHQCTIGTYPQLFGGYVPNLSAIDLLFNAGAEAAGEHLRSAEGYRLEALTPSSQTTHIPTSCV